MILDSLKLDGKVAIITGAGRGLGRAMAVKLAETGADIVAAARTQSQLDETADAVKKTGRKCLDRADRRDRLRAGQRARRRHRQAVRQNRHPG